METPTPYPDTPEGTLKQRLDEAREQIAKYQGWYEAEAATVKEQRGRIAVMEDAHKSLYAEKKAILAAVEKVIYEDDETSKELLKMILAGRCA